ncbi:MAG: acyltransferase [Zoogloeaceae bacterium]|nr:acyltransferase [Zoogloeaceae bacterium]
MPEHRYRSDIDGLRAVAVLAVVINHLSSSILPGGFLGVDIFFVISGYLISSILFRELANGSFSFARFYARRIRRLFPALITVLLAVLVFGVFALFSVEYAQLNRHAYWSMLFLENFRLMQETGYFDAAVYTKPLMHLWSLSIEEQFYLAWPALMLLTWRTGSGERRDLVALLLFSLLLASWLFALYMGTADADATYFHPFPRVWELLLGAALALFHSRAGLSLSLPPSPKFKHHALSLIGVAAIFSGLYLYKRNMAYPGLMTLIPVAGTVMVIASRTRCLGNRFLGLKPLVWIGLISYPLYLWHWPVLSYIRIMESGSPHPALLWAGAALSLLLAALTWRFIEVPVRNPVSRNSRQRKIVLTGLCASMIVLFLASYSVVEFDLLSRLMPQSAKITLAVKADLKWPPEQNAQCLEKFPNGNAPEYCRFLDNGAPIIALVGDSHAHVLYNGVSRLASERGYSTLLLGENSCLPFDGIVMHNLQNDCAKKIDAIFDFLEQTPRVTHLLMVSRGPMYITGKGFGPAEPGVMRSRIVGLRDDSTVVSPEIAFQRSLENTFLKIQAHGFKAAYLLQVPELGVQAQNCLPRPLTLTRQQGCEVPYPIYQERMRRYRELVIAVKSRHDDLNIIDPEPLFCDKIECHGYRDGQLLYYDNNHLSTSGSLRVAPLILDALDLPSVTDRATRR